MINYARLGRSVDFYSSKGFTQIEVPWTVSQAISDITRPDGARDFVLHDKQKVLVASAEQGFLYLALKGFLPPGRFQAITPCFRDEPFDVSHTKYFMKNELIVTNESSHTLLVTLVTIAEEFFNLESPHDKPVIVKTDVGYDIYINNIEVGSYGIRTTDFLTWIYGTALAEPRFGVALKYNK
jgi:seryl-tRNA synthetase